jgi:hypothetical protein|tara:strand:+ start:464 stop:658 length:195 start_codon:yes stop_codon:yes gene_type:complete
MLKLEDSFKGVKSLGVMSYEPPVMLMRKNIRWMIFRNERAPLRMVGGVRGAFRWLSLAEPSTGL